MNEPNAATDKENRVPTASGETGQPSRQESGSDPGVVEQPKGPQEYDTEEEVVRGKKPAGSRRP